MQKARQRLERETGAVIKDWGGKLPFAIVYPNTYFIGMSNLGVQAIYGWLNGKEEIVCERAFWDLENRRKGSLPLSVESQRPLTDFAVLAFSLNYEIDYFNIAPFLKASGIPLYSTDRDETQPLIIAGGPGVTANPMPVAPFFDCLCIGEAEALLPGILPVLKDSLAEDRDSLLKALAEIPGVYVPRHHKGDMIVRQWVRNLDEYPVHSLVLTPDTELKDMYLVEVERGCAHKCNFCLVSNAFSPMRFHSLDSLIQQVETGLRYRRRLGLVGPAVTDHPQIEELLSRLIRRGAQLSVSSLRLTSLNSEIMGYLVKGGMRSVAIAPEAGSECLRQTIRKGITEEQVLEAVRLAAEKGIQQLKLYFMIGLPEETDSDIRSISDLVLACKGEIEKRRAKTRLTLNISPFVPKAGTVFQLFPMASLDVLQDRLRIIKSSLSHQGIQVKNESPAWSEVQAVLSRGDSRLAAVLADIRGESLSAWRESAGRHEIDTDFFAHRRWSTDQELPWKFIRI